MTTAPRIWKSLPVTPSTPANMVVMAAGVTAAAPLADELARAGVNTRVVGDAGSVDYIEGAMHSAWKVATAL